MNTAVPQQEKKKIIILEMRDSPKYGGKFKNIFEWYESTKYRYQYNGKFITI